MTITFDLVEPAVLTGFVRTVPTPANWTLNQFLPDVTIADIDAVWDELIPTNRAAKFRAYDAETSIGKRDATQRKRISLPPLGQKTVIGEEERLKLERARSGGDNKGALIDAIYDDAALNTRATRARMELARGAALSTFKVNLTADGLTGLEADYGVPAGHNPTAPVAWSDTTNADPLLDMMTWSDVYVASSGEPPAYALTSRKVVGNMLRNSKVRAMVYGSNNAPTIITRAQLDQLLDAHELPRLVTYDSQIDVDGVATRPVPADTMALLPQDPTSLGATYWGLTAEGLELSDAANPYIDFTDAPGLIGVVLKIGEPVRTWTKVAAVGLPVLRDTRRLLVADVQ